MNPTNGRNGVDVVAIEATLHALLNLGITLGWIINELLLLRDHIPSRVLCHPLTSRLLVQFVVFHVLLCNDAVLENERRVASLPEDPPARQPSTEPGSIAAQFPCSWQASTYPSEYPNKWLQSTCETRCLTVPHC